MVEVGRAEDGRDGRRDDEGRAVSYEAYVQPLVSVERWVLSARRREVLRPLRNDDADCRDFASWYECQQSLKRVSHLAFTHIEDVHPGTSAPGLHHLNLLWLGYVWCVHSVLEPILMRTVLWE